VTESDEGSQGDTSSMSGSTASHRDRRRKKKDFIKRNKEVHTWALWKIY